jgi:hypothetical protein
MAAGLGFKDFTTGEVLTAADVDGYLMQGIWVFASAAARDAAVTSPQEGNACYLKDTNQVLTYSGSAWVAVGGGSPLTTKGDLYTFSTVDARLGVGANGTTLVADSAEATGLKWAAPASGGALTYITQTDFTTQSSQAFDNVFTSTYDTYLVILENITGSVATADLQLQLRYGGVTATADYYQVIYGSSYSISVMTLSNASTVSQVTLANSVGNLAPSGQLAQFYFRRVGISGKPIFMGQLASNYNLESKTITGFQDTTQTYDGFLLKPDSGNISGNVKIYGIKDS